MELATLTRPFCQATEFLFWFCTPRPSLPACKVTARRGPHKCFIQATGVSGWTALALPVKVTFNEAPHPIFRASVHPTFLCHCLNGNSEPIRLVSGPVTHYRKHHS